MLLDTHALLWYALGDRRRISRSLQKRIESSRSIASTVSFWEIAIKSALGKLEAPNDLRALVAGLGFEALPVTVEHAWAVRDVPQYHRDPFDRLLIAQAQVERLPLLTPIPPSPLTTSKRSGKDERHSETRRARPLGYF